MISFFIKTYGCQANVADSSHLVRYLEQLGCVQADSREQADLLIVNTCAIRKKAEDKMFSYLGELVPYKNQKPYMSVLVIGCVASYRAKEIKKRAPHVDFVFGAREDIKEFKSYLPDKVEKIKTKKTLFYGDKGCQEVSETSLNEFKSSMINIMRGCNNYCSYCIVPFTTGRERSYPIKNILEQVAHDVKDGAKDITLLGQNVNSYKDPESGDRFAQLLERVAQIDGEFWVRFVSPHPKDFTDDVIEAIAKHDKLCSYIHLPVQSGSNKILKSMNRTYTVEEYIALVEKIKARIPRVTISTDIIVGFPGETDQDYQATRDLMEKVRFQMIYSFIYSPRKYTKASQLEDDCSKKVKRERIAAIQARHRVMGTESNGKFVGQTLRVLLERPHSKKSFSGRTEGNIRVFVKGDSLRTNTFVEVKITSARLSDLSGDIVRS
jgi:tRNA-2-methylthio-N6-dimethylallyladenosine synthase